MAGDRVRGKVSFVVAAIFECEFTFALFDAVLKFAIVCVSIAQLEPTIAFLLSFVEITFKDVSVGGHFASRAMDDS